MTTDGIDRLGFLIHDSARLLRKRFEAKGSAYGLSAAQWRLLVRLVKEEGGWIERRQDAGDRRVRMIFPTDKSREAFAAIKAVAGDVYDAALQGLTAEEKLTLVKGLNAIITNLSDGETPAANQTNTEKGNAA